MLLRGPPAAAGSSKQGSCWMTGRQRQVGVRVCGGGGWGRGWGVWGTAHRRGCGALCSAAWGRHLCTRACSLQLAAPCAHCLHVYAHKHNAPHTALPPPRPPTPLWMQMCSRGRTGQACRGLRSWWRSCGRRHHRWRGGSWPRRPRGLPSWTGCRRCRPCRSQRSSQRQRPLASRHAACGPLASAAAQLLRSTLRCACRSAPWPQRVLLLLLLQRRRPGDGGYRLLHRQPQARAARAPPPPPPQVALAHHALTRPPGPLLLHNWTMASQRLWRPVHGGLVAPAARGRAAAPARGETQTRGTTCTLQSASGARTSLRTLGCVPWL